MKLDLDLGAAAACLLLAGCGNGVDPELRPVPAPITHTAPDASTAMTQDTPKTDAEWKAVLTPEQYRVLREKGTERAFTGKYWNHHGSGIYRCAGCGHALFESGTKYDSGCGWPSFYEPAAADLVMEQEDLSHSMRRTEVLCARCGGHLGHVFEDGPQPTGLRYCINSAALEFREAEGAAADRDPEAPGKRE